ncbi:hypothetical protein FHW94_004140 [Novosphingobium sp. SG720]|nr:hypothetical protein [Novosphingobium sp. SG720]
MGAQAAGISAFTRAMARRTAGRASISVYQRATLGVSSSPTPANSRRHSQPKWAMSAIVNASPATKRCLASRPSTTATVRLASLEKRSMAIGCGSVAKRWKKPD